MNKLVIIALAAVLGLAAAEPPSNYGAPSAPIYINDGGYSGGDTSEGAVVDDALLARIAQILSQSSGSSGGYSSGGYSSGGYSAPSDSYGPPSDSYGPPSGGYGAPQRSSGVILGQPERAQLVSEFELQDTRSNFGSYGPPSRNGGPY